MCAVISQLSIFTADCSRHPIQMAGVEKFWELYPLVLLTSMVTSSLSSQLAPA